MELQQFDWKKATAKDVIDRTCDLAFGREMTGYEFALKKREVLGDAIDLNNITDILKVSKMCRNNFGLALGLYARRVNSVLREKDFDTEIKGFYGPRGDQIQQALLTICGNALHEAFDRAEVDDRRIMLGLVKDMCEYYYQESLKNCKQDCWHYIEGPKLKLQIMTDLQKQMQKNLTSAVGLDIYQVPELLKQSRAELMKVKNGPVLKKLRQIKHGLVNLGALKNNQRTTAINLSK